MHWNEKTPTTGRPPHPHSTTPELKAIVKVETLTDCPAMKLESLLEYYLNQGYSIQNSSLKSRCGLIEGFYVFVKEVYQTRL
jgi:hypothetical protein